MKLKIKTLTGAVHEIDAEPSDSIESVKKSAALQTQIPIENQKLVLGAKLLRNELTLNDSGVSEGDVMVIIPKRAPKPTPIFKDPTPIPTKSIILEHTSYGKKAPKPVAKPAVTPSNAISQLRNQLQDLMGSLVGFTSGTSAPTTTPQTQETTEQGTEEGAVSMEVDADALKQLQDMGFPEQRAKKALLLNRMNASLAMEWLLEHDGDADIDEPLSADQLRQTATRRNAPFSPDPAAITKLKDMGFAEEDIIEALRITNNNSEAACAYLLGEGEVEFSMDDSTVIQDVLMNPTIQAGLANPRVLQALKALIENPSSAAQYISDPEIGPVLIQVHNIISGQH